MDSAELDDFLAQQFPTCGKMLYANHAAISPWPLAASEAVAEFARENAERGPMAVSGWLLRESRLRRTIAGFLNASDEDIAFLQNTSEGINVIANGMDWRDGDNVVTAADEYISNYLPWVALAERGVELRQVDIRRAADPEAALIDALDHRSRVLTVSSVQWSDGMRLDLERLGAACADTDACFFVDAIQQFGALQMDVKACRIDALAAGSHKWQMGPEGIGIFYCRAGFRESLRLHRHGWRMQEEPYRFGLAKRVAAASARRFEAGSPNTLGQAALSASMSVFQACGMAEVERRVVANSTRLLDGLSAMPGISIISPLDARRRSAIVAFCADSVKPAELRSRLSRRAVFTAVRGEAVRLSPHFYQGDGAIDRMLNLVEKSI